MRGNMHKLLIPRMPVIWKASCRNKGHEEDTTCITASGRRLKFCAAIDRCENWAATASSRHSCPATSPGAGLLLGRRLLVSGGSHYKWHGGYWTRPPYAGATWIGPRYDRGTFFEGYWEGDRGGSSTIIAGTQPQSRFRSRSALRNNNDKTRMPG